VVRCELAALAAAVVAGVALTLLVPLVVTMCARRRSWSSSCVSTAVATSPSTPSAGVTRSHAARPCPRVYARTCCVYAHPCPRVCAYVTVRVVYSVAVSFAAVLLTLSVVVQPEVERMSGAESRLTGAAVSGESWWLDVVDRSADNEALRQVRERKKTFLL